MKNNLNAVITIAFRDLIKLLRDPPRIFASLIFPLVFVGVLGTSLGANLSADVGYNFLTFVFTGVIGQNLFQSTASGIISLVEDRQNDFAQALFITPVSRYLIIFGKILGESTVALVQLVGILIMGLILGIPLSFPIIIQMIPFFVLACLLGGAFGVLVMANLSDQRQVNQIFPFIIFPQFFLSGVFSPIKKLPFLLLALSRISPMTYAVDLIRNIYYRGLPEYSKVVLHPLGVDIAVVVILFLTMSFAGTLLFVRNERNR